MAPPLLRRVTLHARRRRYHDGGVECSCRIEESRIMPIPAAARPLTVCLQYGEEYTLYIYSAQRAGRSGRASLPRQLRSVQICCENRDCPRLPPSPLPRRRGAIVSASALSAGGADALVVAEFSDSTGGKGSVLVAAAAWPRRRKARPARRRLLQAQSTRALGPLSPAIGMGRCRSGCSCESLQSRRRRTSATSAAWRWSAARGSGARSATSFCA